VRLDQNTISEYREVSEKAIIERIQQLEKQLGYVRDNRLTISMNAKEEP
jgi:hypothetical protein